MINAAVIGSGIGAKHIEALKKTDIVKIKYIYEKDIKKISSLKKKFKDIDIISSDKKIFTDDSIKLVCIASYDNYHYKQILSCIKNQKHFFVEKPMCLNLYELQHIYNLMKKNKNIFFSSNLVLRTNDLFNKIKKKTNINDLFYIEGDYIWGRLHKLYDWRSKISGYSIILGACIHMIDLINWILGMKPEKIYAQGNKILTKKTKFKKDSFVVLILKFKNGIIAKVTANSTDNYQHYHELKIFEKKKTVMSNILGKKVIKKNKNKVSFFNIRGNYPDKENRYMLLSNFAKTLRDKNIIKKQKIMKQNFDLMSICLSGIKSLQTNKEVKIKYLK